VSPQLVGLLAAIFAAQSRVLGMQAENAHRAACGASPAYGEEHFAVQEHQLSLLSLEARNAQ
jgi:hypothetical protein